MSALHELARRYGPVDCDWSYARVNGRWLCAIATSPDGDPRFPRVDPAWGATPEEAAAALLAQIDRAVTHTYDPHMKLSMAYTDDDGNRWPSGPLYLPRCTCGWKGMTYTMHPEKARAKYDAWHMAEVTP